MTLTILILNHMGKKISVFKVEPESAPLQIQDEIDYKSEQDQLSEQESLCGGEVMATGAQNNLDPMELEGPFTCQMHQALVLNACNCWRELKQLDKCRQTLKTVPLRQLRG